MKKKRIIALLVTILLLFGALDARIFFLSGDGGSVPASTKHGSYSIKLSTGRGTIYDCGLRPLVNLGVKFIAVVSPQKDAAQQLRLLTPHVKDMDTLENGFQKSLPFTVEVDTPELSIPGVSVVKTPVRYSQNAVAPHVIGYIDSSGDGVSGIEKAYNDVLKEYSGNETVTFTVDAKRRALAGVAPKTTVSGNPSGGVELTVDGDIQRAAQCAADKYLKSGCVIVMDIKTGDILASCSEPEFSPLHVSSALKGAESPLLNRVLYSYNLGSAFKIAVASAALESGTDESFGYTCTGVLNVAGRDFHCEDEKHHGPEDMAAGFANSCNTYFITLGIKTGGDRLLEMAQKFGFGTETRLAPGISSSDGSLPTGEQLKIPAALANFSIGEGDLMATPVQVACMVSAVANGGSLPTARLVKGIYDGNRMSDENKSTPLKRIISAEVAQKVRQFMIKTVDEGTGMPAKPVYGGAGGKTATAETGWRQNGKDMNQAWFAGFYPAQSPRYAIVAMCENGKAGGADAGPVFKYIADSLSLRCGFPKVNQ